MLKKCNSCLTSIAKCLAWLEGTALPARFLPHFPPCAAAAANQRFACAFDDSVTIVRFCQ